MDKKKFIKPAYNINKQIELFQKRILNIQDPHFLRHCLKTVSYYRLSGYCKIFQEADHTFKPNTDFQHIWELYTFDQELRLLLMKAIEKIEIAFRTAITNYMCTAYNPVWYKNNTLFKTSLFHKKFMLQVDAICREQKEVFIRHFFANYTDQYPPAWMITECISFGTTILIFRDLNSMHAKKAIAQDLGFHPTLIASWMESIGYTRNLCAHHLRIWNRWFVVKPQIPNKYSTFTQISSRIANKFYAQALIIILLLQNICPEYNWQAELFGLLQKYPAIPKQDMGFGTNWESDPLWKIHG